MTQPNQYSIRRSQIRQWARSGGLTDDVIAKIDDARKRGQVIDDIRNVVPEVPAAARPLPIRGGSDR